jgi:hypothetical protein
LTSDELSAISIRKRESMLWPHLQFFTPANRSSQRAAVLDSTGVQRRLSRRCSPECFATTVIAEHRIDTLFTQVPSTPKAKMSAGDLATKLRMFFS